MSKFEKTDTHGHIHEYLSKRDFVSAAVSIAEIRDPKVRSEGCRFVRTSLLPEVSSASRDLAIKYLARLFLDLGEYDEAIKTADLLTEATYITRTSLRLEIEVWVEKKRDAMRGSE